MSGRIGEPRRPTRAGGGKPRPCGVLLALVAWGAFADEPGPWDRLARLRAALAAAPLEAPFEQSYTPAGFTGGETESGRIAFDLPECLRWDYDEPYPKSYLLCGYAAWSWNPGERSGRRLTVAADEEPGLDLLRLRVETLRTRYRATGKVLAHGGSEVRLEPLEGGGAIADATLNLDPTGTRLQAVRYRDAEGNVTRFTFGELTPATGARRFQAPIDIVWIED